MTEYGFVGNYCEDCKYCKLDSIDFQNCWHPKAFHDLSTVERKSLHYSELCSIMRMEDHACGREGKLFESGRVKSKKPWLERFVNKLGIRT